MVTTIKLGRDMTKYAFATCPVCGCVFRFEKEDVRTNYDMYHYSCMGAITAVVRTINCPNDSCQHTITLDNDVAFYTNEERNCSLCAAKNEGKCAECKLLNKSNFTIRNRNKNNSYDGGEQHE